MAGCHQGEGQQLDHTAGEPNGSDPELLPAHVRLERLGGVCGAQQHGCDPAIDGSGRSPFPPLALVRVVGTRMGGLRSVCWPVLTKT